MIEENKNCIFQSNCNHIDCDCDCLKKYKLTYLYDSSLMPIDRREKVTLVLDKDMSDKAAFTELKEIEDNIVEYVNKHFNLYIYSTNTGNGKTSWALRIIQSYLNKIWPKAKLECKCLYINTPQFLLSLKDNITNKNDYIEYITQNVYNADIVVWDDIGNKATTQFENDNLLSIIDNRINNGKSNIYTSNLNLSEMHNYLGDRLTSRVINSSKSIELKGGDKRNIKIEG